MIVPILRAGDAEVAAAWYERLGFTVQGVHQFAPDLPRYLYLRRGDVWIHLSEHAGDARPAGLVYLYLDDVDTVAAEFGVTVETQPWTREIELTDPDGNRLRIGTRHERRTRPGYRSVTPRVVVSDVAATVEFLRRAFDATGGG